MHVMPSCASTSALMTIFASAGTFGATTTRKSQGWDAARTAVGSFPWIHKILWPRSGRIAQFAMDAGFRGLTTGHNHRTS